ncbi:MAG: glycoside hydrolase [Acidobacteria bacterium]|nr:glycoside hydrolase [Acidobacteriota bacterium]
MIRALFLWHMHQPYYKDLVSGEYRLPWTRLHALKDYYGMVKLLDEFPAVHQTFNLVPSLITQIEEYAAGTARDPFLDVAAKPAGELTPQERTFTLQYLFQANPTHMIGRYPRYRELFQQFRAVGENPDRCQRFFHDQDYTDLQVLSQIAWFDEFFLTDPEVAALIRKERGFTVSDQQFVISKQRDLIARVLPAYKSAADRGFIEISTSPFYHPILPLLCDTDAGAESSPGLPLPHRTFRHPEDAEEQLRRGLSLHERVFGLRPRGLWPSEGSVSDDVVGIARKLGFAWMATDEGVLGRSLGRYFSRDQQGRLQGDGAKDLYTIYEVGRNAHAMHFVFRDHSLSDLIGFVYSGMPARDAAAHLIQRIKESAELLGDQKEPAVIPIILDGENAWEYYPESGREFLRRVYEGITRDPKIEAVTVSEAIAQQKEFATLEKLVPGSWINANFNVWIGAPEDNRAWDYLNNARDFYSEHARAAAEGDRQLAFEEILIAEGSDWNWWYGPEHHSANDRDFDELYRKHLWNVYHALGGSPPDYLAQPITTSAGRPYFVPQTAYIHPRLDGVTTRYFDWVGAAMYTADRRSSSMHGRRFLFDAVYAGIDEQNLYGRLDFVADAPQDDLELIVTIQSSAKPAAEVAGKNGAGAELRLRVCMREGAISSWDLVRGEHNVPPVPRPEVTLQLGKVFEFGLPLSVLGGREGDTVRLRFSVWREGLPIDALPLEGWIELLVTSDEELRSAVY